MQNCIVRYNKCHGPSGINTQTSRSTYIYFNEIVVTDAITGETGGLSWNSTATAISCTVQMYNNTVYFNGTATNPGVLKLMNSIRMASGCEIYNNIFKAAGSSSTNLATLPEDSSTWLISSIEDLDRLNYNVYDDTTPRWRLNGTVHTTIAAYKAALASAYTGDAYGAEYEANSQHATVTFAGANDYRLANNGQAALTASLTGGPVGCYVTGSEEIGLRANPTY